jgi:hypothetical protein
MTPVSQVPRKMNCGYQKDKLLFAITFSDVLTQLCPGIETLMGDVTYGACCIDDYTVRALDCDLFIHYAHSCFIPDHVTKFNVLYAFVDITIDASHLLAPLQRSFASSNFKLPLSQESQRSGSSFVTDAIVHPRSEKKGVACENTSSSCGLAYILTSTLREDTTIDHSSSANRQ